MKIIHPQCEYWIESKLDQEMMDYVWSQIKMARENNETYKDTLVGHFEKQLHLPDTENKLNYCVSDMAKSLDYIYQPHFAIRDLWVNFQKKHDFNPVHVHSGALSFVIWMQIPYTYEDEANTLQTKGMSEPHKSGCFQILYTTFLGKIFNHTYNLDTAYEGTIIIFPASFSHIVYPFYTSNQERISISGNIY